MQVLAAIELSEEERQESVRAFERFVCGLATLRARRAAVVAQLAAEYGCSGAEWLGRVATEAVVHRQYLAGSAAVAALTGWLRAETDLFCDLLTGVMLEVRPADSVRAGPALP